MRRVFLLIFIAALMLTSCGPKTSRDDFESIECCTILIDGPTNIRVGETIVMRAIAFDENNVRIKNRRYISPDWTLSKSDIIVIEEINEDFVKLKGVNPGKCKIRAMQDKAVSTAVLTVQ
ncbi:MAG: hypothetical protein R6U31_00885 [bacterium]